MLELKGVTKRFGGLVANDNVSMKVEKGQVYGIIGPNGAGKTTLFNCITGFLKPEAGQITFEGRDITSLPANVICRAGIARTFQIVQVLDSLTVRENAMVGAFCRTNSRAIADKKAREVLEVVRLSDKDSALAGSLNIAQKKRLQIARALATGAKLVMLDEAMAGLTEAERMQAVQIIKDIKALDMTIVLIEHVMEVLMPVSDRVLVLNFGKKIAEDTPANIIKNEEVINAYLGGQGNA